MLWIVSRIVGGRVGCSGWAPAVFWEADRGRVFAFWGGVGMGMGSVGKIVVRGGEWGVGWEDEGEGEGEDELGGGPGGGRFDCGSVRDALGDCGSRVSAAIFGTSDMISGGREMCR